ncbi:MAG: PAS domain-containing protein, partial [Ignavibacteriales bacterium]
MQNRAIRSQLLKCFMFFTLLSTVRYGALIFQLSLLLIRHGHVPISSIVPWILLFILLFTVFMFMAFWVTRKISKLLEASEDAYQRSQWKYRHIFESSVDIFVQTDLEGIIQMVSPSIKTMSGWDPEELIGQPVTQYYGDASLRSELVQLLFDQKSVFDFTTTALGKNGSRAIVSVNSVLTYDDQTGQPNGIMSWIRDVTEQRRLQEALSETQKRMSQIIDFLPDATFAIDREGVIIAWNRAMEELTGFKAEHMIGKGN